MTEESNIKEIILGKLPAQLVQAFGEIDNGFGPLPPPLEERVLNAWRDGKSSTVIAKDCGVLVPKVTAIVKSARLKGDARAVYRGGWAKGMIP